MKNKEKKLKEIIKSIKKTILKIQASSQMVKTAWMFTRSASGTS